MWEESDQRTIYVVGHGWHPGLILPCSDVAPEVLPEIRDFSGNEFVELGWGDEGFYRASRITVPLVLQAAFWPTPSVVHASGFSGDVSAVFPHSDILELTVSEDQFDSLCRFAAETLKRDTDKWATSLGPGIYGDSRFYRANGSYYMPKTCNIWTAKALCAARIPVTAQTAIRAEGVIRQVRRSGQVVQKSARGLKRAALTAGNQ